MRILVLSTLLAWLPGAFMINAAEPRIVSIAAASDLVFCMEELNKTFSDSHPNVAVKLSTGSSGNFFAQIQNGAPFDVYLSADITFPKRLIESGHADSRSLSTYAIGRLVLWTMNTNLPVSEGLAVLKNPAVKKFAIADPEHAPYGAAARAALQKAGLWDSLQSKLVRGENIAQTFQYAQTGNADVALVALSLVSAPSMKDKGAWWLVPESEHPKLEQALVLTTRGRKNPFAREYLAFLRSKEARAIFDRYGFQGAKEKG